MTNPTTATLPTGNLADDITTNGTTIFKGSVTIENILSPKQNKFDVMCPSNFENSVTFASPPKTPVIFKEGGEVHFCNTINLSKATLNLNGAKYTTPINIMTDVEVTSIKTKKITINSESGKCALVANGSVDFSKANFLAPLNIATFTEIETLTVTNDSTVKKSLSVEGTIRSNKITPLKSKENNPAISFFLGADDIPTTIIKNPVINRLIVRDTNRSTIANKENIAPEEALRILRRLAKISNKLTWHDSPHQTYGLIAEEILELREIGLIVRKIETASGPQLCVDYMAIIPLLVAAMNGLADLPPPVNPGN
ncbi:hypothetical protein V8J88_05250 [Massilia sp. W12]|uniref:hypothetical protein n=1 Tax=Massilia sp. W12 TaxID=3126507 RepID=UPI0030CEFEEF